MDHKLHQLQYQEYPRGGA